MRVRTAVVLPVVLVLVLAGGAAFASALHWGAQVGHALMWYAPGSGEQGGLNLIWDPRPPAPPPPPAADPPPSGGISNLIWDPRPPTPPPPNTDPPPPPPGP